MEFRSRRCFLCASRKTHRQTTSASAVNLLRQKRKKRTLAETLNHTFFLGRLEQGVNQYFVHIMSLVTDNNLFWISGREENGCRNYYMINLHESMGPGRVGARDPWICSQTRICNQTGYRLHYAAQWHSDSAPERIFQKKLIFKIISRRQKTWIITQ